jgi:hypothetical protein
VAQPSPAPVARRRPTRRRSRWPLIVGILLVLLVLLAVGDRVASAMAAGELRSRIAEELAVRDVSYASLDVDVAGTPFLTQVAQGRYEEISIELTQVHLRSDDREVTLPGLHLLATGVRVDTVDLARGDAAATAELVTGRAVVSYATLSGLLDLSSYHLVDIAFAERDGALQARANVSLFGVELPIEATTEVSLRDGQIELRLRDAAAVGQSVPDVGLAILDAVANLVLVAVLPPLPFDITIGALDITPDGLAITATGRDVTLARPGD